MGDGLTDDQLKLVSYTIVFTKPGQERIMPGGQGSVLVLDSVTEEQFIARIIAEYMDPECGTSEYGDVIKTQTDAKYLKVHYAVPRRWPKEPLNADERQSRALEQVHKRLQECKDL